MQWSNMLTFADNGDGIEENKKEAANYFKIAANKGNTEAITKYASILEKGDGIEADKAESNKYYRTAIDKGLGLTEFDS